MSRLRSYAVFVVFPLFLAGSLASADQFGFRAQLKPQDYLFAPNPERRNDLFDSLRPVDLGVDLAIGSDCGKINVEGTLRSTFGKVLSGDYFKGLAQDILGSAPMLAACYMSPTWCAILKHTQLSANFLTQTRLNQCQIIDKYVDSRVEDYYRQRQDCIHRSIQQNGGDMDSAMASCQNGLFQAKAGNWAGGHSSNPASPNELLGDSVKWAGFNGAEGDRVSGLLKSMIGDTVLVGGNVRVEYGPRAHAYSPRSHLISMEQEISQKLCGRLIPNLANSLSGGSYVNDGEIAREIKSLSSNSKEDAAQLLTPDVVRNLAFMPKVRRERVCAKLSQAIAMEAFTRDMNRSLDVLTVAAQNPNLPPNRRQEIESKRMALKDQIDLTLKLRQEQEKPAGEVMKYISEEGLIAQDQATRESLMQDSSAQAYRSHSARMNDCADGVFCGDGGGSP